MGEFNMERSESEGVIGIEPTEKQVTLICPIVWGLKSDHQYLHRRCAYECTVSARCKKADVSIICFTSFQFASNFQTNTSFRILHLLMVLYF